MKKIFLFCIICIANFATTAQVNDELQPAYLRITNVPPFKLLVAPDSTLFEKINLKKRKPTIIMVFSPDCDHCIISTQNLIANYKLFKKVQIILATSSPFANVNKFYTDLNLANYPNIKVGQDNTYFLGQFFSVRSFPSIYLYDKKGNFKKYFDSNSPVFATGTPKPKIQIF
ncbi:MAG: hypothetical protein ABL929_06760 [Ferruginibacter sp.]|nr:hypothetical protein [Ferruginibacter sp.]